MAKPLGKRERNRAERREAILAIAHQSFLQDGYDRTTMSGIAEAMGGSKGTLWSYFESKEELFGAVIDRAAARYRAELTVALDPAAPPAIGLLRFAERFVAKISSHEAVVLQRVIIGEGRRFPELGPIFFVRAPQVMREILAGYIAGHMASGALRSADPIRAATMLVDLCAGGHHQRVLWNVEPYDPAIAARDAAAAIEHFLYCYGPNARGPE